MNGRAVRRCFAAVAAAALLTAASGCGMFEKPSASVTGVKVENIGLTDATMLFDVKVDNPYSVPLPMSNFDYALSSAGERFLSGEADAQGTVPAGGSKTIGLPVRISYVELINAVQGARPGASIPYKADLGLSVKPPYMGAIRVPMTREGKIDIPSTQGLLDRLKDLMK